MLLTRILTALVLLPIVLLALFRFPAWGWGAFCILLLGIGAREWARLAQLPAAAANGFVAAMVAALLAMLVASLHEGWQGEPFARLCEGLALAAMVFWCLVAPWWLATGYRPRSPWIAAAAGAMSLLPMFAALLVLRAISPWLLLSFAVVVWVADVAAYFAGKGFGRRKLAPSISPGKTLEGAAGGLAGVVAYFFLWRALATASPSASWAAPMLAQGFAVLAVFLVLGVVSIIGDLFESWMKRGAGLKDSGSIFPGHGGVLDRIDALTSSLPLALAYAAFAMNRGAA